jgi:hypothetical protein
VIHNEGVGQILDVVTTVWVRAVESAEGFREVRLARRGPDVTEVGAGETGEVWLWLAEGEEIAAEEEFFPQVEFTDCDGGRWRRRDTDQPVRVADADGGVLPGVAPKELRFLRTMLLAAMLIALAAIVLSIINL